MRILLIFITGVALALSQDNSVDVTDGEESRKILGSSVVTSVSVIMDSGNGSKTVYTDAVGKPIGKPSTGSELASPINLLNPDRYEFYTFDDNGDLVKRLMSLDEIKGIIATGDSDGLDFDSFTSQGYLPEKRVNEVVNTVQNVLKEEIETHKNILETKPLFDTPDVSDSWSMILPAVFGNSGEDIKPEKPKPITHVTPDTIMIEPNSDNVVLSTPSKGTGILSSSPKPFDFSTPRSTPISSFSSTIRPIVESTNHQISTTDKLITLLPTITTSNMPYLTTPIEKKDQSIKVEIYSNSKKSTTVRPTTEKIIEIKEKVSPSTEYKVTTHRPTTANVVISSIAPENKPTTDFNIPSQSSSTNIATITTFSSVSSGSTLPTTTGTAKKPIINTTYIPLSTKTSTKRTTDQPFTTWRTESIDTSSSEDSSKTTHQFSTWHSSNPTTSQKPDKAKLPTLSELLNSGQTTVISRSPITVTLSSSDETTTDNLITSQTKYYDQVQTTQYSERDTTTINSKPNDTRKSTPPLEQAMTTADKVSASELLGQLLLTTNIYEINTELAERTTNNLDSNIEEQRFETTTPENIKNSETKTQTEVVATTEKFLITVSESEEQINNPTTDDTLIGSIEQLLSQAVGDVEEVLMSVNNTSKIQEMLDESNKTVSDVKEQIGSFASNLEDRNANDDETVDKVTTETASSNESYILNDSLESLLSQISDPNEFGPIPTDRLPDSKTTSVPIRKVDEYYTLSGSTDNVSVTTYKNSVDFEHLSSFPASTTERVNETTSYYESNQFKEENTPALINITILNPDSLKNRTKPAKLDASLEEAFNKDFVNPPDSTEIYIETVTNNDRTTSGIPNELHKFENIFTEHTVKTDSTTQSEKNEFYTDTKKVDNPDPIFSLISSSNIPFSDKPIFDSDNEKPTTIIIIKRTERPPFTDETTTVVPDKYTEITTSTEIVTNDEITTGTTSEFKTKQNVPTLITEPTTEIVINETQLSNISFNSSKNDTSQPESIQYNTEHTEQFLEVNTRPNIIPIRTKIHPNNDTESTWTLVSTIAPHNEQPILTSSPPSFPEVIEPPEPIDLSANPMQGFGLEESTSKLDNDIFQFAQLCNELAFGFWKTVTTGLSSARSVFVSPFGATSLLAMVFLGARGATSGEMNEILKLDDMVTFNPHLIFKNVSESIRSDEIHSGVATSAIIRELFSDRSKGKLLPFYKERARAFYDGFVEEVSFREIGDVIRRRTNLQIKKYTDGKIGEFLKDSSINARTPLAGISINLFQTDCSKASTEGRDGELHFVVLPSIRQRRLVPIPAVVYKSGFLAGYEPSLDATAVSFGSKDKTVSTIMVIPGQQGMSALGDGLARLEKRLVESSFKKGAWSRLLRSLIPRINLEVQIPRFSHRSIVNASLALQKMGLHELFDVEKADLRGLNGVPNELFLSDIIQINNFATCGEKIIGDTHHSEIYPAGAVSARSSRRLDQYQVDFLDEPRDYQRAFHDPLHDPSYLDLPLPLRPRQARVPDVPRLKFDRPFLYFVRHNPTGLILHMGRFNPRLLP